ncbi:MAG: organic solvent tolerance protein [Proteobacteria bacterium]|nr:MAG: organic solvent tolerance protein [Pseudomonadota bacterium]
MIRRIWTYLVAAGLAMLTALPASAQMAASLVADRVELNGRILTATGNVTAFSDGVRLSAGAIRYDGARDQLSVSGPILITNPDGTVLTATQATLDPQLETGLLLGARLVLDRRLQLASARVDRAGPLTQMTGVAATSCNVCPGKAPLWEIRAARVVHDADNRRLWFDNAQFRLGGVPIAWLPRLRLPDPTVDRAAGLLLPRITSSNRLGVGLKWPVFVPVGDHRDITLTPWITRNSRSLGLSYREAFASGDLSIDSMVSDDSLKSGLRGYVFAQTTFRLPRRWLMEADLELASDDSYLLDYGITDKDRLDSRLALTRVTARRLSYARITGYESLRDSEDNLTQPTSVARLLHRERLRLGKTLLTWEASLDAHHRRSSLAGTGRDMARIGLGAQLDRRFVFGPGFELSTSAMARLDGYAFDDPLPGEEDGLRRQGGAAVSLSWPLARHGARVTHIIEPRVTLSWSDAKGITPPNEDATRVEFDETNLHGFTRAPGEDLTETGRRASIGLSWTMQMADGAATRLTFGRILRDDAPVGFSESSGLAGAQSDWLLALGVDLPGGFSFDSRSLIADDREISRSESRIRWAGDRVQLSATHVFLSADLDENRAGDVSEWALDGDWQVTQNWALNANARYDIASDRPVKAGLGATWKNECVSVGLSASRRFTTLDNVPPSTDFGLEVSVEGFRSTTTGLRPARACR